MRLPQCRSAASFTVTQAGPDAALYHLNTRWRHRFKYDVFSNSISVQIPSLRMGKDTTFLPASSSLSSEVMRILFFFPSTLNAPREWRLGALCCPGTFLFGLDVILCYSSWEASLGRTPSRGAINHGFK